MEDANVCGFGAFFKSESGNIPDLPRINAVKAPTLASSRNHSKIPKIPSSFEAVSFSDQISHKLEMFVWMVNKHFLVDIKAPACGVLDGCVITFTNETFINDVMRTLAHANNLQ